MEDHYISQPPTLLTLPPEIRQKILHYTISIPNRHHSVSNFISVLRPRVNKKGINRYPKNDRFYGTTTMSSLFVLCRLLHAELEEILFTRFIFAFAHYTSVATVQDFTTTISPRACTLLREIAVGFILRLTYDEEDFTQEKKGMQVQDALVHMKKKLPGLKKIHLGVGFIGGLDRDVPDTKRRIDEYADIIVRIATIIAPGIELVLDSDNDQQCRKDIMQVCFEKVEELRESSKTNGTEWNVKVLKHTEVK